MKRSLAVMGFVSAATLTLIASPSFSQSLDSNSGSWEQSGGPAVLNGQDAADGMVLHPARMRQTFRSEDGLGKPDHDNEAAGPRRHAHDDASWPDGMGPDDEAHGPHPSGMDLAASLAPTEIYIGINVKQMDAWRAYTSAVIDFLEPSDEVRPRREGQNGAVIPPLDEERQRRPVDKGQPPLFAERLADDAIARAEKAKTLKDALEALRLQLSAGQIDRLAKAERMFQPPRPPRGFDDGGDRRRHLHDEFPRPPAEE